MVASKHTLLLSISPYSLNQKTRIMTLRNVEFIPKLVFGIHPECKFLIISHIRLKGLAALGKLGGQAPEQYLPYSIHRVVIFANLLEY